MISHLTIRNFKSIRDLSLQCKKLNILIGEPNSGKSNIIEALALQSQNALRDSLNHEFFRYKNIGDLFYDFNINNPVEVSTEDNKTILKYAIREDGSPENQFHYFLDSQKDSSTPTIVGQTTYERTLILKDEFSGIRFLKDSSGNTVLMLRIKLEDWIIQICKGSKINLSAYNLPEIPNDLHEVLNNRLENFGRLIDHLLERKNPAILKLKTWLN